MEYFVNGNTCFGKMDWNLKATYLFVFIGGTWLQASRYVENCSRIFSVLKLVEERVKQPEKVTFHISHGHKIFVHCMSTNICSPESTTFPHIVENGVRTLRHQESVSSYVITIKVLEKQPCCVEAAFHNVE